METLKQRLLEHIADLLDEPTFDLDMRLRDCIDPLPNEQSELHLLMTDAAFKVFCNYFGKEDTTKQCAINGVGNCKTEPSLNRLETELGKLQKVHGEITKHFELHSGCNSFKFKDGAVYRVKIERSETRATLD